MAPEVETRGFVEEDEEEEKVVGETGMVISISIRCKICGQGGDVRGKTSVIHPSTLRRIVVDAGF